MSSIYDNCDFPLLPELKHCLKEGYRSDFCVGYFNLRGWRELEDEVEQFTAGKGQNCRLLVGMQKPPNDELKRSLSITKRANQRMSNEQANELKKIMAHEFREQLTYGVPTARDEASLKRLKSQLQAEKLEVKLFLRHLLHAKLYLIYREDKITPRIGYVGSSNLTFSGLSGQGELNVEVTDRDDTKKLEEWFIERWEDNFSLDISQDLIKVIDESWAGKQLPPFYIYLKMAYHLSQEARDGLSRYQAPKNFGLLEFQEQAVRVAMQHIYKRNGVVIGDVVGLGKTLVGTAIAHVCEEEYGTSTLIICPKNLESMWQGYVDRYGLRGKVVPISQVEQRLPEVPAWFRLVLIDESHNLRNREGKRYQAIKEYIEQSGSRCILLTATPYNKGYLDLSSQLRLFLRAEADIGIKPEAHIRNLGGEMQFLRKHNATPVRSLMAFEHSDEPEDWQQLMSRYMVRRTRGFIKKTYAKEDERGYYLEFPNSDRFYFPKRRPRTVKFSTSDEKDPYARLYGDRVVDIINSLNLPRYGLGNYLIQSPGNQKKKHKKSPGQMSLATGFEHLDVTEAERKILANLSHAGQRLMGFCRTNLFKRLESSGAAFIQSIDRHILRNYVYLHAIANNLPIPIGTQDSAWLDGTTDEDQDSLLGQDWETATDTEDRFDEDRLTPGAEFKQRAVAIYQLYQNQYQRRFKWIRPDLFTPELADNLEQDAKSLIKILKISGRWNANEDGKLQSLIRLLTEEHPDEKILIFTQFADTARYLAQALETAGITNIGLATGNSQIDPTILAQRFSPRSNGKVIAQWAADDQLRILVATDVLSEGQNLQDARIILNYDLPWAIIRLIQRAGRVDRIGQEADEIFCYSFLPAEGVEQLINLRGRLRDRLKENQEVVGTDEAFFEDDEEREVLLNLYNEKANILDEEDEGEVDLTSEALQIWQTAIDVNPKLKSIIEDLPDVVFSTRHHGPTVLEPEGVLLYLRTAEGTDALAWVDKQGHSVTQSQMRILRMAGCDLNTPALNRHPEHHNLVQKAAQIITDQTKKVAGTMGSRRGARARTYDQLISYCQYVQEKTPILAQGQDWESLVKAIEMIHNYPLKQNAIASLNRELKAGISDEDLAQKVTYLMEHDALCVVTADGEFEGAKVICSLGLFQR
ncbi:helicase-related protein [Synechocystis salina]|uniref:NgoFVII family restriction endonuclease n=1 Tax=Synechocystis salina LEGE 00031 TaxID=1828736 RepID=A0ABR9VVP8_9SYNC|nr:helicase-related protein [Synechocystis salina]MBE9242371.1 NgoFVII family restriction endonuclease [Synechocystis salina LEGE 00041]MBE9255435.1 NgoFVII family restriction endonuclease [Synechocystis salina LEGE 00031]